MTGPTSERLAEALDVSEDLLVALADNHHDPTPDAILTWAEAGERHRDAVEEWLSRRERQKQRERQRREERLEDGEL